MVKSDKHLFIEVIDDVSVCGKLHHIILSNCNIFITRPSQLKWISSFKVETLGSSQ